MGDTEEPGNAERGGEGPPAGDSTPRQPERRGLYGQRPSASHDEVVRREFARVAAMTARERMIEALSLSDEIDERGPPTQTAGGRGGDRP